MDQNSSPSKEIQAIKAKLDKIQNAVQTSASKMNEYKQNPLPALQQNQIQWDQFEIFKRKVSEEKQRDRNSPNPKQSYSSLERISFTPNPSEAIPKYPIVQQQCQDTHLIKENQELKEQVFKLQEKLNEIKSKNDQDSSRQSYDLQHQYQIQLRQMREKYELENRELLEKLNNFTDELEELKKVYKEKNMKLYSLVLQLEKEKQELIEASLAQIEPSRISIDRKIDQTKESFYQQQIKEYQDMITQLEKKNKKLIQERIDQEIDYQQTIKKLQDQLKQKQLIQSSSSKDLNKEEDQKYHFKQRTPRYDERPPLIDRMYVNPSTLSLMDQTGTKPLKKKVSKKIKNNDSVSTVLQSEKKQRRLSSATKSTIHLSGTKKQQTEESHDRINMTPKIKTRRSGLQSSKENLKQNLQTQSTNSIKQFTTGKIKPSQQQTLNQERKNKKSVTKNEDKKKVPLYSKATK